MTTMRRQNHASIKGKFSNSRISHPYQANIRRRDYHEKLAEITAGTRNPNDQTNSYDRSTNIRGSGQLWSWILALNVIAAPTQVHSRRIALVPSCSASQTSSRGGRFNGGNSANERSPPI